MAKAATYYPPRASRHLTLDVAALRKRRKKNKAAAKQRRINRSKKHS